MVGAQNLGVLDVEVYVNIFVRGIDAMEQVPLSCLEPHRGPHENYCAKPGLHEVPFGGVYAHCFEGDLLLSGNIQCLLKP